jgi:hypothetical protein
MKKRLSLRTIRTCESQAIKQAKAYLNMEEKPAEGPKLG